MVYDGEFIIVNRYHDILDAPPISDGYITVGGHIMVMVFGFLLD